ncbi:hypothetical protein PV325_011049 [Microctonus aethiopoides]|nr:hypothetical protein PV325_011049 [Microctonus aethiopoides]
MKEILDNEISWKFIGWCIVLEIEHKRANIDATTRKRGCRCKGNCGNMCGCQKTGLKCSGACLNCSGETCSNTMNVMRLMDENDFEDEIPTMTPVQFPTFLDDAVSEA